MSLIVQLGPNMSDCPIQWQNMIAFLQKYPNQKVSRYTINSTLAEFHACLIRSDQVEFQHERGYTHWLLRFS